MKIKMLCLAAALFAAAGSAGAQAPASNDQTYLDFQVEQPVKVKDAVAPQYPAQLKDSRVSGEVIVQFVVDESGSAQMGTFKVLKSNDSAFSDAVKRAVAVMTFFPAEYQGKKVRQLVQVPFKFVAK